MISEDKEISDIELDDALRYLLSMGISNEKINKTLDKLKSVEWSDINEIALKFQFTFKN